MGTVKAHEGLTVVWHACLLAIVATNYVSVLVVFSTLV